MTPKSLSLWLALTVSAVSLSVFAAPPAAAAAQEDQADTYVKHLLMGQYDALYERFDPTMQRALPLEKLKELFDPERASRGPLKNLKRVSSETQRGFQVLQVEAAFERGLPLVFTLSLRTDGRIAGLRYKSGAGAVDQAALQKAISEFPGKLSVTAFVAEKPDIQFRHQDQVPVSVASQFKILVLAKACEQLAEGSWKESQRLPIQPADRSFPSGVLHMLEPGLQPTIADLLGLMISISDNTATDTLIHALGRSAIEDRMEAWGFKAKPVLLTTAEMFGLTVGVGGVPADPAQREAYLRTLDRGKLYQVAGQALAALSADRDKAEQLVGDYYAKADYAAQSKLSHVLDWRMTTAELADFYRRVGTRTFGSPETSAFIEKYLKKGGPGMIAAMVQEDPRVQFAVRKGGSDIGIVGDGGYITLKDGRHIVLAVTVNELPAEVDENAAIGKVAALSHLIVQHLLSRI